MSGGSHEKKKKKFNNTKNPPVISIKKQAEVHVNNKCSVRS